MPEPIFVALAVLTIASAILALEARELVYGAIALGMSFIGVAALFILLSAPYLAMFQVAVYIGAVVVLILFTIMLVRRERGEEVDEEERGPWRAVGMWVAGLVSLVVAGVIVLVGLAAVPSPVAFEAPLSLVGSNLVVNYSVPLVVLGLVISAALIGALTLAKIEREGE